MGVYKRQYPDPVTGETRESKFYSYRFEFEGRPIRKTTKTTEKRVAEDAEREHRRKLVDGVNDIVTQPKGKRLATLAHSLDKYFDHFKARHPETYRSVEYYVKHLKRLIGNKLVIEITEEAVKGYQTTRIDEGAAPKTINDEVGFLLRVLEDRGDRLRLKLKRTKNLKLQVFNEIGRAFTTDEKDSMLAAAKALPRSHSAFLILNFAQMGGLRKKEIRTLRWRQVDLIEELVVTERAKTKHGENRPIPMNADLMAALLEYVQSYREKFGETKPDWYVFPFGKPFPSDPTKPVTNIDTAWMNVKTKAGIEGRARFHDNRHTWKTDLGRNPANADQTLMNMGGWGDSRMLKRYGHTALSEARKAVAGLERKKAKAAEAAPHTVVTEAVTVKVVH